MSRLLSAPVLGEPRSLEPPEPALDAQTERLLEEHRRDAYERGRADGVKAASDAVKAAAESARISLADAVQEVRAAVTELERDRAATIVDLAERIAIAVLGREPQHDGRALLDRLRDTVQALDHGPFVVRVSPADEVLVAQARAPLPDGSSVEVDATLRAGEVRIEGPWSQADLTRETMVAVLAEALSGEVTS